MFKLYNCVIITELIPIGHILIKVITKVNILSSVKYEAIKYEIIGDMKNGTGDDSKCNILLNTSGFKI